MYMPVIHIVQNITKYPHATSSQRHFLYTRECRHSCIMILRAVHYGRLRIIHKCYFVLCAFVTKTYRFISFFIFRTNCTKGPLETCLYTGLTHRAIQNQFITVSLLRIFPHIRWSVYTGFAYLDVFVCDCF